MKPINLAWFRRDLRLLDNHMLHSASEGAVEILPFYIFDNWHQTHSEFSPERSKFTEGSLKVLSESLQKIGGKLLVFEGDTYEILRSL